MIRLLCLSVVVAGLGACVPCGGGDVPLSCDREAPPMVGSYLIEQDCSALDRCLDGAEVELTETELILRYTDEGGNVFVGTYPRGSEL